MWKPGFTKFSHINITSMLVCILQTEFALLYCRYMREYSLLLRDVCVFVCLDDKHRIKVGKLYCCIKFDFKHYLQ